MKISFSKPVSADFIDSLNIKKHDKKLPVAIINEQGQKFIFFSKDCLSVRLHFEEDEASPYFRYLTCLKKDEKDPKFCPYCAVDHYLQTSFLFPVFSVRDRIVVVLKASMGRKDTSLFHLLGQKLPLMDIVRRALHIRQSEGDFTINEVDQPSTDYGKSIIEEFLRRHNADNPDRWSPELEQELQKVFPKPSLDDLKKNVTWINEQFGSMDEDGDEIVDMN